MIMQLVSIRDEHMKRNAMNREEANSRDCKKKSCGLNALLCYAFWYYHRCSSQLMELTLLTCTAEQGTLQLTSLKIFWEINGFFHHLFT